MLRQKSDNLFRRTKDDMLVKKHAKVSKHSKAKDVKDPNGNKETINPYQTNPISKQSSIPIKPISQPIPTSTILQTTNPQRSQQPRPKTSMTHSTSRRKLCMRRAIRINQNLNNQNCQEEQRGDNDRKKKRKDVMMITQRKYQSRKNSKERLYKSKSMVKLGYEKTPRLSPLPNKVQKDKQQKNEKYEKNEEEKQINVHKNIPNKQNHKQKQSVLSYQKSQVQLCKRNGGNHQDSHPKIHGRMSNKTDTNSKMSSVVRDGRQGKDIMTINEDKYRPKGILKLKIKSGASQIKNPPKAARKRKQKRPDIQKIIQRSIMYSQVNFHEQVPQNRQGNQSQYESSYLHKQGFLPLKSVKTEGCYIQSQYHCNYMTVNNQQNAAIIIQRHFRGYIVRKYLSQARQIIEKVKKIQRCWREYRAYRLRRNKKNLSISSSLITIKDFNESIKEERLRYGIEKENSFSNRKMDLKEILREIMEEAAVDESIKLRLRNIHRLQETNVNNNTASQQLTMKSVECGQSTQENKDNYIQTPREQATNQFVFEQSSGKSSCHSNGREKYVKEKINNEIHSERIFHSPRNDNLTTLKTPKHSQQIPNFFCDNLHKDKGKLQYYSPGLVSPRHSKITPRKVTPKSAKQEKIRSGGAENGHKIEGEDKDDGELTPFQTTFQFNLDFCLTIVDYFREQENALSTFLTNLFALRKANTYHVLGHWHTLQNKQYCQQSQSSSQLQFDPCFNTFNTYPSIFSPQTRDSILRYPQLRLLLQDAHYHLDNPLIGTIHRSYLQLIFDCFQQAIWYSYREITVFNMFDLHLATYYNGYQLFQHVAAVGLGLMQEWAETLCGSYFGGQPVQEWMALVNQQREKVMVENMEGFGGMEGGRFCVVLELGQAVFQEIIREEIQRIVGDGLSL